MIRQKDYQWEAAIKVAKEDGADYVAILLGRLRDAQKEIEALEAAQQRVHPTPPTSLTDIAIARADVILAKRHARKMAGG